MHGFQVGSRWVGPNFPPLVIAEIGINHGGSLDVAIQMVDAAANSGAEIVKHQTHVVADEMSSEARKVIPSHTKESIYAIMESCALDETAERKLQQHAHSRGMIFISTPFSRAAAERLRGMDIPAYKIGSGECNNYPLIEHIASIGKPIILSTGMNSIESVGKAVAIFRKHGVPFSLLHCTNVYPTPPELVRLGAMSEMQRAFPDAIIGLSDHTTSNYACLGAVALGACILERHFTDTMERKGPDISCSMDPRALRELIEGSAILQKERGGSKGIVASEEPTARFAYATVVTIADIGKGDIFSRENIWVKRPGTGAFLAEQYETLLGKRAARSLPADHHLDATDVTA